MGAQGRDDDLLHPHSGLAVSRNWKGQDIAAITDRGALALYHFHRDDRFWSLLDPREVIEPPGAARPPGKLEKAYGQSIGWMRAADWQINPFSDICTAEVEGEYAVFVAGTSVDGPGLLRWRRSDGWQMCVL